MGNLNATTLRFTRLRHVSGNQGIIMPVCTQHTMHSTVAHTLIAPIADLAQGRIVSISRGSPPPKQR